MLIPYEVDVPSERRPIANWLLVVAIGGVFVWQVYETMWAGGESESVKALILNVNAFTIKGLFGHMWLHAGLFHLGGNLLFLWLFGNAVCGKIGNLFYLPIYVALGLVAAIVHIIAHGGAMAGASGAINGIVGMYVVFFPRNDISCLWMWFILYARSFTVSGFWLIGLWFVFDIFGALRGAAPVAYFAHIGGFLAGFALAIAMLKLGLKVERYEESLLQVIGLDKDKESKKTLDSKVQVVGGFVIRENESSAQSPAAPIVEEKIAAAADISAAPPAGSALQVSAKGDRKEYIRFYCTCGKRIKVPARHAGRTGKCPKCSKKVTVPTQ